MIQVRHPERLMDLGYPACNSCYAPLLYSAIPIMGSQSAEQSAEQPAQQRPPAPSGFDVARQGIEQGKVEAVEYDSKTIGIKRRMVIYTPAGYSKDKKYSVLYLLHGMGRTSDGADTDSNCTDFQLQASAPGVPNQ
jgi:hypothetical protein